MKASTLTRTDTLPPKQQPTPTDGPADGILTQADIEGILDENPLADAMRQYDLFPPRMLNIPITIVGAGAIGSWAAVILAKMKLHNLTVYDHDHVELVNMSPTVYGRQHINARKVDALAEKLLLDSGAPIQACFGKFTADTALPPGILISAVDNMGTRKMMYERIKAEIASGKGCDTALFIDARMSAEILQLHVIPTTDPDLMDAYGHTLFTDGDALAEPCTRASTTYTAAQAGAAVAQAVGDYIRGGTWSPHTYSYLRERTFQAKIMTRPETRRSK